MVLAFTGMKPGDLPEPFRIFDHPDRPEAPTDDGRGSRALSVAEFQARFEGKGVKEET